MSEEHLRAEGWSRLEADAFTNAVGQIWLKGEPGSRVIGFVPDETAANHRGVVVHGGALMTFADIALGIGAGDAYGTKDCATAQLNYQFAGVVSVGSLVTCQPEVVRMSGRTVFMRALLKADGAVVGAVDAIFKAYDSTGSPADNPG